MYVSGLDGIVCYLFEFADLIQLKDIIRNENRSIFKKNLTSGCQLYVQL